jgi:hypothetical protein
MTSQSGVFVIQSDHTLVAMRSSHFETELDFQRLLAKFPELLVGDQINPESPRRFILIRQEQGISHEDSTLRWSVDHLFVDQDGIPTLVEVKRKNDTRLRREVVGQMLDYASNCHASLTIQAMQYDLDETCAKAGLVPEVALGELIGPDQSIESFWSKVDSNLRTGKIRMLFVADRIPTELRRIVEFLNRQMTPAEILAIELRQFSNETLRTIVPMVFGQTQEGMGKRAKAEVPPIPVDQWIQEIPEFFGDLQDKAIQIVRVLGEAFSMRMAYRNKGIAFYNTDDEEKSRAMFVLRREIRSLEFYLANFSYCRNLASEELRKGIVDQLAKIVPGYRTDKGIDGYPLIKLQNIPAAAWPMFVNVLQQICNLARDRASTASASTL